MCALTCRPIKMRENLNEIGWLVVLLRALFAKAHSISHEKQSTNKYLHRQLINSNRSQPVSHGVRRSDGASDRSSWQRRWIREFCPMYNRRYVWCRLVRPTNTILWPDHHAVIPMLAYRHRCASPLLHTRICSWLVPEYFGEGKTNEAIFSTFQICDNDDRYHLHDNRSDHHGHRMLRYKRQVHATHDRCANNCSNVRKLQTLRTTLRSGRMWSKRREILNEIQVNSRENQL